MRTFLRFGFCGLVLASSLTFCRSALAADPKPTAPEAIQQSDPHFFVMVDVDKPDRNYREGEKMAISVTCEQDAYIYVLYKQADGRIYQIFPNSGQTDNRVKAKTKTAIPAADDLFRWHVAAPFGKELLKVIASKEPLKALDDPEFRAQRFNPVPDAKVKDVAANLAKAESQKWTEHQVEITTHEASWNPPPPPHKRFGVFFGVGKYQYDDLYRTLTDESLNRSSHTNEAVFLCQAFKLLGKLDDSRFFLNENATRSAIKEAITDWLYDVSAPGDTVFVFFGGHGEMLIDKKTKRLRLACLLPYDAVGATEYAELIQRREHGTITPAESQLLTTWQEWVHGNAKPDQDVEDVEETLARRTGVTADVFAKWLQRLAGRQIVIMLGSCHSAAFAAEEWSVNRDDSPPDFLDSQLERLNGIGQKETVLLAACGSAEEALSVRSPDEKIHDAFKSLAGPTRGIVEEALPKNVKLSVFGYNILESMLSDPAPTTIETTFDHCRRSTAEYIEKLNAELRKKGVKEEALLHVYQPRLYNHSTTPVIMKPAQEQ